MRTVAIIQARMDGTRLSARVLQDLVGQSMLTSLVGRVGRAERLDQAVVATWVRSDDDFTDELCSARGWNYFRGSEDNVLDRCCWAAVFSRDQIAGRITLDRPLIERQIVAKAIQEFRNGQPIVDYISNFVPLPAFPRGLDTELLHFDVSERTWRAHGWGMGS